MIIIVSVLCTHDLQPSISYTEHMKHVASQSWKSCYKPLHCLSCNPNCNCNASM